MSSHAGFLIRRCPGACTFLAAAALLSPAMVLAQSAEPAAPTAMPAQALSAGGSLTVVNKPIFVSPVAGALLLSANPHPISGSVVVSGIEKFRIVFPPASPHGKLTISGIAAASQGPWKPQRWYAVSALGIRTVKLGIQWQRTIQGIGAASTPPSVRAADISIDGVSGTFQISAGSALAAGGGDIGRGRGCLDQMVVEVCMNDGNTEKIQFLPIAPQHRVVLLGLSTPAAIRIHLPTAIVAAGTAPQLSLRAADVNMRSGGTFYRAQRSTSAHGRSHVVWVNLAPGAAAPSGKPQSGKLIRVWFRLAGRTAKTNYAEARLLAATFYVRLKAEMRMIAREPVSVIESQGLDKIYRRDKRLLAEVVTRYRRLRALRKLTLCIELYPGGPVLETITYEKPTAATRPGLAKPAGRGP